MTPDTEMLTSAIPSARVGNESGSFARRAGLWVYEREHFVPFPRGDVYAFFAEPGNLGRLMPVAMRFELVTADVQPMHTGQVLEYRFRFHGVPMRWTARIDSVVPGVSFLDEQLHGPFAHWRHEHALIDARGGTLIRDHVEFRSPLGALGRIADVLFVKRSIEKLFDQRCACLNILLDEDVESRRR